MALAAALVAAAALLPAQQPATAGALRAARYPLILPDSTQVKVLRRGVITCSSDKGNCVVVLDEPVPAAPAE
jgi:hypothetical protein